MKRVIIGDTHVGARGSNPAVRNFIDRWFRYCFSKMQELGITEYIQTGDFYDVRKSMNGFDMEWIINSYIPLHKKYGVRGTYIDGNHDIPYRESNQVSWVQVLEMLCPSHIKRIDDPEQLGEILFLPWINEENVERTKQALEASQAKYCVGHLELGGFKMYSGSVCEESRFNISAVDFKKFQKVLSGHFHTMSEEGNIKYVGTPYPLTWQDYQDAENNLRGFHIFDDETGELEFIPNPENVKTFFKIFVYDYNQIKTDDYQLSIHKNPQKLEEEFGLKDKIVKVVVLNRDSIKHYQDFVNAIRQCKTIDTTFIDQTVSGEGENTPVSSSGDGSPSQTELEVQTDILQVLMERVEKTNEITDELKPNAKTTIKEVYDVAKVSKGLL